MFDTFLNQLQDSFSFNNNYYKILIDDTMDWRHFDNAGKKSHDPRPASERWQWQGEDSDGQVVSAWHIDGQTN